MLILLDIIIVLICIRLSFEDFKSREISVWLIVLLGAVVIIKQQMDGVYIFTKNNLFNLLFLAVMFLILYIKLKNEKRENIKSVFDYMGEGDWLVLIIFAFAFNYMNYLSFFFISVAAYLVFFLIRKKEELKLIPLAGMLCSTFVVQVVLKYVSPNISLLTNTIQL